MKIIVINVIDTDKKISDGITNQLPDDEVGRLVDLGDICLDCEEVIRNHLNKAKRKANRKDIEDY